MKKKTLRSVLKYLSKYKLMNLPNSIEMKVINVKNTLIEIIVDLFSEIFCVFSEEVTVRSNIFNDMHSSIGDK